MSAPANIARMSSGRTFTSLCAHARARSTVSTWGCAAFQCAAARRAPSTSTTRTYSAAAYQPYPLFPNAPPPPRNENIPETSIAQPSAIPKVSEAKVPTSGPRSPSSSPFAEPTSAKTPASSTSAFPSGGTAIPESEAQVSRPPPSKAAAGSSTSASASTTPARPRSRLRAARKAVMKLTPAAVDRLRDLLDRPDPKLIKIGVRNRGCSGLAYHLEEVDQPGKFDEEVTQDGVRVLVDSKALFSIIGSEMDWVEDRLNQRFVFRNPNIKEECGCGESFMV